MYVVAENESVRLMKPDDCTRFHIELDRHISAADADNVLRSAHAGRMHDHTEGFIRVTWIREQSSHHTGPGWDKRFDAMIAYAAQKRWLSEDGQHIRAHVITTTSDSEATNTPSHP